MGILYDGLKCLQMHAQSLRPCIILIGWDIVESIVTGTGTIAADWCIVNVVD
jgi:hypothetical protein